MTDTSARGGKQLNAVKASDLAPVRFCPKSSEQARDE